MTKPFEQYFETERMDREIQRMERDTERLRALFDEIGKLRYAQVDLLTALAQCYQCLDYVSKLDPPPSGGAPRQEAIKNALDAIERYAR